jgi:hypothetical protein
VAALAGGRLWVSQLPTDRKNAQFSLFHTTRDATERAGGLKYGEVEVGEEPVIFDSGTARR